MGRRLSQCLVITGAQNLWQLLVMRLIQPRLCSSWWMGQSRIPGTQKVGGWVSQENLVVSGYWVAFSKSLWQLVVRSLFVNGNCLLVDRRLGQVRVPGSLWIYSWVSQGSLVVAIRSNQPGNYWTEGCVIQVLDRRLCQLIVPVSQRIGRTVTPEFWQLVSTIVPGTKWRRSQVSQEILVPSGWEGVLGVPVGKYGAVLAKSPWQLLDRGLGSQESLVANGMQLKQPRVPVS